MLASDLLITPKKTPYIKQQLIRDVKQPKLAQNRTVQIQNRTIFIRLIDGYGSWIRNIDTLNRNPNESTLSHNWLKQSKSYKSIVTFYWINFNFNFFKKDRWFMSQTNMFINSSGPVHICLNYDL